MTSNRKSRLGVGQKPISLRQLAVAVLVLVAAGVVGMAIREYRFRLARQKQVTLAQKAVQPAEMLRTSQATEEPEIRNIEEPSSVEQVSLEPAPPAPEFAGPPTAPEADRGAAPTQMEATTPPSEQDSHFEDPAVKERRGREALAMIGHDPDADAVWIQIINDPSIPPNARKNLIEDLNEDGLSFRNLTIDDLPVIQYRIELIEYLRPYAMDKVNADAFDEARKDLVNMADRLAQR